MSLGVALPGARVSRRLLPQANDPRRARVSVSYLWCVPGTTSPGGILLGQAGDPSHARAQQTVTGGNARRCTVRRTAATLRDRPRIDQACF